MAVSYFDPNDDDLYDRIQRRAQQFADFRATVRPEEASGVSSLAAAYKGTLPPGVIYTLGRAGISPDSEEAAAVIKANQKKKGFFDNIGERVTGAALGALGTVGGGAVDTSVDVLKGFSRGTFAGLGSIKQSVDATFREADEDGDIGLGDVLKTPQRIAGNLFGDQTELGQGIREIGQSFSEGKPFQGLDYGDGYFVGGDVKARQTRKQIEASGGFEIDGQFKTKTIGRGLTAKVVEDRSSTRYSIMSGLIDATTALASDPSTYFGGSSAQALRGRNSLVGSKGVREIDVVDAKGEALARAKAKATQYGEGQATPAEFVEDVLRYGSDNPRVAALKDKFDQNLLTRQEMTEEVARLRDQIKVETGPSRSQTQAQSFLRGDATATELAEDALQFGSELPTISKLVDKFDQGLITKSELAAEIQRVRPMLDTEAGLIKAPTRKASVPEKAADWLESGDGRAFTLWAADTKDFNALWKGTKQKLPVKLVRELQDAQSPEEIKFALAPYLNNGQVSERIGVRLQDSNALWGNVVGKTKPNKGYYRLAQKLPGQRLELGDPDDLVMQADRYMRNANLPEEVISKVNSDLASVAGGPRPQVYEAIKGMFGAIENQIVSEGVPKQVARTLTRAWDRYSSDGVYFTDELGNELSNKQVMVNGKWADMPTPHQLNEFLNRNVPLPNVQDIKKATGNPAVRALLDQETKLGKPGFYANEIADFVTNQVWTPLRLIRGAYVIRNVAEAQARMAVGGFDNGFTHPIQFLAWAIGDEGKVGQALGKVGVKTGRGKYDAEGNLIRQLSEEAQGADAFSRALQKGNERFTGAVKGDNRRLIPGALPKIDKTLDAPAFTRAWAGELAQIATDDVQKLVLRDGVDAAKAQFFDSDKYKELMQSEGFRANFGQGKQGADAYIDSLFQRIQIKTGGSTELQDALRHWRLEGVTLFKGDSLNPQFLRRLDKYLDNAPQTVKGNREMAVDEGMTGVWNKAVDAAFDLLATRPENFLNNSPVMAQAYWRRMADFTEYLTPAAQQTLLQNARKNQLPKKLIEKIEKRTAMRSGEVEIADASQFAASRALKEQKALLYTADAKTQFFNSARAVFVFGDALRNTAATWTKLFANNPTAAYRGGLGIQGLRDLDTDGDGKGFFTRDELTGQEVFVYPGSSALIKAATGVETGGFKSPVTGLNLLGTSVIPSLGPVTGYAAAQLLPDTATYDGVTKLVFPFGKPEGALDFYPAWFKKLQTAGYFGGDDDPRRKNDLASATHETFRYLLSTGEYDIANPTEVQDALDDAKESAQKLFAIRGMAQFFAPSPPSPKFIQYDKNGKVYETFELSRVYRQYLEEDPDTALERFIDTYGELAVGAAVSKTEALGTSPANKAALDFARANPDTIKRHKDVYGLFLTTEGDFDLTAYGRQMDTEERQVKDPDVFVNEVRARIARTLLDRKKAEFGDKPSDAERRELRTFKEVLQRDMLFNDRDFNLGENQARINKLQQAVGDPNLSRLPAGEALALYLTARDRAMAEANKRGIGDIRTNGSAADLRGYLRRVGESAVDEFPEFATMWERVFSREIGED